MNTLAIAKQMNMLYMTSEFFRGLGEFFADRVGQPGRDVRPRPGKGADDDADRVAAQEVGDVFAPYFEYARVYIAYPAVIGRGGRRGGADAAHDLRDSEESDENGDHMDAREQFRAAEGEARLSRYRVIADGGDEESEEERGDALYFVLRCHEGGACQSQAGEPEVFVGAEVERDLREERGGADEHDEAEESAYRGEEAVCTEDHFGLALLREFI